MANIGVMLKQEITRLARKETKAAVEPLRKANTAARRELVALRREVADLQRQLKGRVRAAKAQAAPAGAGTSTRFSAKGLKSLRARTGLSAADFGRLAGASGQSIYHWEAGKTVPGAKQRVALAALRGLGKREALRRLEALG